MPAGEWRTEKKDGLTMSSARSPPLALGGMKAMLTWLETKLCIDKSARAAWQAGARSVVRSNGLRDMRCGERPSEMGLS